MNFKRLPFHILISIYAIIVLLFALITFTYAYFHDVTNIDYYQIYESSKIDIKINSLPADSDYKINFFKTPVSKITDDNYTNFNNDIIVLDIIIANNSLFSVKTSIELIGLENNHYSMVYWLGIDLADNNYQQLILEDIGSQNDFESLVNSLEMLNNNRLKNLKNQELLPQDSYKLSIVFWMEWDQLPQSLNIEFNYLLKISAVQFNGDW